MRVRVLAVAVGLAAAAAAAAATGCGGSSTDGAGAGSGRGAATANGAEERGGNAAAEGDSATNRRDRDGATERSDGGAGTNGVDGRVGAPVGVRVRRYGVRRDGFAGSYAVPRSGPRKRAVLALGGSDGSVRGDWARQLAGAGHPTLALAYFKAPGLQRELRDVPLERVRKGLRWLARRDGMPVLLGGSRGGELALLVAATYPREVHAVVGLAPSAYVQGSVPPGGAGWTLRGRRLPRVPDEQFSAAPPPAQTVRRTVIHVERFPGPVFLVGGDADNLWPSGFYVRAIAERLRRLRPDGVLESIVHPLAGHYGAAAINLKAVGSASQDIVGGTPEQDLAARRRTWPRLLRFLDN